MPTLALLRPTNAELLHVVGKYEPTTYMRGQTDEVFVFLEKNQLRILPDIALLIKKKVIQ